MFYPCTTKVIRSGVKTIAVVNFIWSLALITLELVLVAKLGLQSVGTLDPEFSENFDTNTTTIQTLTGNTTSSVTTSVLSRKILSVTVNTIALSMVWIISWLVDMAFSILLFSAASYKSIPQSLIWFYFRCAALVIRAICLVFYVVAGLPVFPWKVPVILLFIFRIYSLWVVNLFVNELRDEKRELKNSKTRRPTVVVTTPTSKDEGGIENKNMSSDD